MGGRLSLSLRSESRRLGDAAPSLTEGKTRGAARLRIAGRSACVLPLKHLLERGIA